MRILVTLTLVAVAIVLLLSAGTLLASVPLQIHANGGINAMIKYQAFALLVGLGTMASISFLYPDSKELLTVGRLKSIAIRERWLGINGKSSWRTNGLQLLLFISLATGIFMALGVWSTDNIQNFQGHFIPYIILFAFTNALSEELIFRFGLLGGLHDRVPKRTLLLISAVVFGLPHFYGNPGGFIGVLMSAFLGYILSKATLETKGLGIAMVIHFVQDVIIFTAVLMMTVS
ncbi:MAG: type II CAAX endopeptidase family protein [Bacteroidota bacterium]